MNERSNILFCFQTIPTQNSQKFFKINGRSGMGFDIVGRNERLNSFFLFVSQFLWIEGQLSVLVCVLLLEV